MTPHDHREYVQGCYRCELNRSEVSDDTRFNQPDLYGETPTPGSVWTSKRWPDLKVTVLYTRQGRFAWVCYRPVIDHHSSGRENKLTTFLENYHVAD
jgi:hypothetical protein